ncbi:MAG TPA: DUF4231 domain-containing protein [Longimicrobium sp.]|nr:DUF4231 domain-containing protein [Longimicrobium sp.]
MLRRYALFKRLPKLRLSIDPDKQILDAEAQREFPEFAADFALLEKHLLPSFRELDAQALGAQNEFWMEQLLLIVGALLATLAGALHAVGAGPGTSTWAWTGAIISAVVATVSARARELRNQEVYRTSRLQAELLRGEYFRFLGREGAYENDGEREAALIRRVAKIQLGGEINE